MRRIIEWIALGSTFSAPAVSPAATPTISVPPKAKITPSDREIIGMRPIGKKPPLSVRFAKPARPGPTAWPVMMAQMATSMKITMAATLMAANQNSASPKYFTLNMFSVNTRASAMSASNHCGTGSKKSQKWRYSATAVMSAITAVDQLRKNSQPVA